MNRTLWPQVLSGKVSWFPCFSCWRHRDSRRDNSGARGFHQLLPQKVGAHSFLAKMSMSPFRYCEGMLSQQTSLLQKKRQPTAVRQPHQLQYLLRNSSQQEASQKPSLQNTTFRWECQCSSTGAKWCRPNPVCRSQGTNQRKPSSGENAQELIRSH